VERTNFSRSAALTGLADVAAEFDIDIVALAKELGLSREALVNPNLMIPNPAIGRLYGRVSELSGLSNLSLIVAARRRLSNLGVVGFAMHHQPTLLAAVEVLRRYFRLHNEAVSISYVLDSDELEILVFPRPNIGINIGHLTRFSAELAIGVLFRGLCELSSGPLVPLAVSFVHSRGAPLSAYNSLFGVEPMFDQESNGISFSRSVMEQARRGVDPNATKRINALIETVAGQKSGELFLDHVHDLLMTRMTRGLPDVQEAASLLRTSPRTLNRRLANEDSTYQEIVQQIRMRAVLSYLESSKHGLLEISSILGFTDQGNFSRWFRRTFGITPTEHRRLHKRQVA
jgi:AraC-like DNA-binding protein